MSYVSSIADIEKNAFALLDVVHGNGPDRDLAIKLVKGSFVYYPIQYEDSLAFVPSKFIGYKDNSVARHESVKRDELRDGRQTNVAVGKILGKPIADEVLEGKLADYCHSVGVEVEKKKHSFWRVEAARRFTAPVGSAINDIQSSESKNDDPEYVQRMSGSYIRDNKVRREVIERAGGRCEYGAEIAKAIQCWTFNDRNGEPYLEAHHVIKLSEQGKDKASNVIALCANHHREAHFGENWKFLQDEFLRVISEKLGR